MKNPTIALTGINTEVLVGDAGAGAAVFKYTGEGEYRSNKILLSVPDPCYYKVHFRVVTNDGREVAITDNPNCIYIDSTQFWNKEDTYSIYVPELDMTIIAPQGSKVNTYMLMPAIQKLRYAKGIIEGAINGADVGHISDDDGLHVYITVNTKRYPMPCTLYEDITTGALIFEACPVGPLQHQPTINNNNPDDTKACEDRFAMLYYAWWLTRYNLGYPCPAELNFTPHTFEWIGPSAN